MENALALATHPLTHQWKPPRAVTLAACPDSPANCRHEAGLTNPVLHLPVLERKDMRQSALQPPYLHNLLFSLHREKAVSVFFSKLGSSSNIPFASHSTALVL